MKFSLVSDLHINHPQAKTPYDLLEEIVVVAGDTSNGLEGLKFLQKLRNKGHTVIAVDGNHEHYNNLSQDRSIDETTERFRDEYPDRVDIQGVTFIQRNGWYPVEHEALWKNYMNDQRYCRTHAEEINRYSHHDYSYLEEELRQANEEGRKCVVTTHTAPCIETLNKIYEGHYSNDWYWNPKMQLLFKAYSGTILVWCHGHTHTCADKVVDGVRVVCNPRGYPGENPDWKPYTVEV